MTQEDFARLLAMQQAFNREGFGGLEPFLHPDFEFHEPPEQPGATVFRGREAAMAGFAAWAGHWAEQHSVTEGITRLADGRIVVLTTERLVGRDRLTAEHRAVQVLTLEEGRLTRWQSFWDRERALGALGVSRSDFLPDR